MAVPSKTEVKPMCASGYPLRLDPKTLPFYAPPRDLGRQCWRLSRSSRGRRSRRGRGQVGGGSLDLNEENDRRALITARMYGLVIARRNSGSIAFGRAKAPHKLVDQVDAADQQDRELGTWRDEMMQQNE